MIFGRVGVAAVSCDDGRAGPLRSRVAYWHLLAMAIVGGVLASALGPAAQTYVVDVVGRHRTDHAISLNAIGASVGTIGGAALAGCPDPGRSASSGPTSRRPVASCSRRCSSIADPGARPPSTASEAQHALGGPRSRAWAYVRARPPLMLALFACAMALFNGAVSSDARGLRAPRVRGGCRRLRPDVRGTHGRGDPDGGALADAAPADAFGFGLLITGTMFLYATGVLLYAFAPSFELLLPIEFLLGVSGQAWHICALIGFQLSVPNAMRGRVLSAWSSRSRSSASWAG